MEAGLKLAGGKCILNSMNFEDGEEKFDEICRLAKTYGAAAGRRHDRRGQGSAMARTAERKIAIARAGVRAGDDRARPRRRGHPVRSARAADHHRHRRGPAQRAGDDRGHAADLAASCPSATPSSACPTSASASSPRPASCSTRVFLHELREAGLTGAIVHCSARSCREQSHPRGAVGRGARPDLRPAVARAFDPLTHFIGLFKDAEAAAAAKRQHETAHDRGEAQAAHHRRRKERSDRAPRRGAADVPAAGRSSTPSCWTG